MLFPSARSSCARISGSRLGPGRTLADLSPRFSIHQTSRFFRPSTYVHSPTVRSVEGLGSIAWMCHEAESQTGKPVVVLWLGGTGRSLGSYSGFSLGSYVGKHGSRPQHIDATYKSQAAVRNRHLQCWERQHMSMNDEHQYRSARVRPRVKRKRRRAIDQLLLVRKLLLRWRNALKKQEQMAENQRRKALRQRKKEQTDHRRLEALKRKRAREEQAATRLRSRADQTADT